METLLFVKASRTGTCAAARHALRAAIGVRELFGSFGNSAFFSLAKRHAALRENLAERWRMSGGYGGARDIVSGALLQEHFLAATRVWSGINVMTIHKAKGKEFDEVIVFEGAHVGRLVRDNATDRDIEQARLALRVAVTRARSRTTVLTPRWQVSPLLF